MTKPWIRLWGDILDDPKVQSLNGPTFKMWTNLLLCANRHDQRGALPPAETLAFWLRLDVETCGKLLDKLESVGLIDRQPDGRLAIHNWGGRQFESDSSTPRVQKYRNRQRGSGETFQGDDDETLHETPGLFQGSVSETLETQTQTKTQTQIQTQIADDVTRNRASQRHAKLHLHVVPNPNGGKPTIDVTPTPEVVAAPEPPRRSRAKAGAAPCPPVDELIDAIGEWADRKGISNAALTATAERFANYCAAGKGDGKPVVYADYGRALQNWINRDLERGGTSPTPPRGGGRGGRMTTDEAVQEAIRRRRERDGLAAPTADDADDAIDVAFSVRRG